ncbi:hypothetical protein M0R72_07640 [Candidatus Pacearchaeota archaeon]|jgi:hypothetical protein|nr:hypothetical protein [Candidatus Pacearchaeota archaeon]
MPSQTSKSSLVTKLGSKLAKAVEKHAEDKTEYDVSGNLPGGIEGGIAKLVDCKFVEIAPGKTNAGEILFYAAATVVRPVEVGGQLIKGLRTQINEPLFDTPTRARKTFDEHVEEVMNRLRILKGVKPGQTLEIGVDDLESLAAEVKEEAPYIRFRTWAGSKQTLVNRNGKFFVVGGKTEMGPYKSEDAARAANKYIDREPMVSHYWGEVVDFVPEEGDEVVDESGDAEEVEEEAEEVEEAEEASEDESEDEEEASEGDAEADELDELATQADDGDKDAVKQLKAKAIAAGISKEAMADAENWAAVVEMMRASSDEEEETEEEADEEEEGEDEEDADPEKGDVVNFKPPKAKKAVEAEVLLINAKKQTANVRTVDDRKVFKDVPLAQISKIE